MEVKSFHALETCNTSEPICYVPTDPFPKQSKEEDHCNTVLNKTQVLINLKEEFQNNNRPVNTDNNDTDVVHVEHLIGENLLEKVKDAKELAVKLTGRLSF